MRLISQDGKIDVPYEISALSMGFGELDRKYNIYIRSKLFDERPCVFAVYTTKEKAVKAMEMVRETFLSRMELDGGYDGVSGCYVQPNFWVLPKIFKFPADDEIEV